MLRSKDIRRTGCSAPLFPLLEQTFLYTLGKMLSGSFRLK